MWNDEARDRRDACVGCRVPVRCSPGRMMAIACLLLPVALLLNPASGQEGMPEMSVRELADLVESYQNRFSRLHATASVTYGTSPGNDVLRGKFVPKQPAYSVNMESALDLENNREYFRQNQLTQGKHDKTTCAFDGRIGTRLVGGDDRRPEMIGTIELGRPMELAPDKAHHMYPAEIAYWPIPGTNIAEVLRSAKASEVGRETVDGLECYRVTVLRQEATSVSHEGKTYLAKRNALYRFWLSPQRNMLPVRVDILAQKSAEDMEGEPRIIRQQSDFREFQPGLWFPFASRRCRIWKGKEPTVTELRIDELAMNGDVTVPARIEFPTGTHVTDSIRGVKYRAGAFYVGAPLRVLLWIVGGLCAGVLIFLMLRWRGGRNEASRA